MSSVVAGEAGIGKTSLVRAFVRDRQEPVLIGSCEPLTTPRPLQALHDMAHQAGGRLAALMASDAGRHDLFTALLDRLTASPTAAVVEDVHWADEATLDLLVFLGRRLTDTGSVLLLTVREPTTDAPPRLAEVLGHLSTGAPHFLRIDLQPLSVDAVAVLAGGHPSAAARVHAATAGNPFFVTEVLASAEDEVPATVKDAVLGRAARLGDGARAVLEAAAVVPDRIELALLYAVSGSAPADVEVCERVGLLEVGPRFATYRHELARLAVVDSLPAVRRQQLHAAVVAHLLTRPGHLESRIAHHADLAGDSETVLNQTVLAAPRQPCWEPTARRPRRWIVLWPTSTSPDPTRPLRSSGTQPSSSWPPVASMTPWPHPPEDCHSCGPRAASGRRISPSHWPPTPASCGRWHGALSPERRSTSRSRSSPATRAPPARCRCWAPRPRCTCSPARSRGRSGQVGGRSRWHANAETRAG